MAISFACSGENVGRTGWGGIVGCDGSGVVSGVVSGGGSVAWGENSTLDGCTSRPVCRKIIQEATSGDRVKLSAWLRGAINRIIPLYFETAAGMTDILVGYASPFGVSFDAEAVQTILDEELWVLRDPLSLAMLAAEEADFETLELIDADDCVILYGRYTYTRGEELYSLRFFNDVGEVEEMLEDLPGIDAAEREFPLESLDVNEGMTLLTFSLIYDGRLYTYEIDLITGELDMA